MTRPKTMILITGATGNIGREVVNGLLQRGEPIRATAIHDEDTKRIPEGVEVVIFDFADQSTYARAVAGVEKVFLMRPPQITDMENTLNPFVAYAKSQGVKHIIFVSLLGVEDNPRVPHYAAEQYIKTCGVPYTFLRPSFFMQNLNTVHQEEIRDRDEIYLPVAKARTSFIDTRDIGAAAAQVLCTEGHDNRAYDLTGGEALDYYQAADIFSEVLGRKITYKNPSRVAFFIYSLRHGVPFKFALVMQMLYSSTRKGMADVVTDDFSQLMGRPPITFRQYVTDYVESWRR